MDDKTETRSMGHVIQIDEARINDHLREMVRGTVEETLTATLDAEAAGRNQCAGTRCGRFVFVKRIARDPDGDMAIGSQGFVSAGEPGRRVDSQLVAERAEAGNYPRRREGHVGAVPERLAPVDVREVELDHRHL